MGVHELDVLRVESQSNRLPAALRQMDLVSIFRNQQIHLKITWLYLEGKDHGVWYQWDYIPFRQQLGVTGQFSFFRPGNHPAIGHSFYIPNCLGFSIHLLLMVPVRNLSFTTPRCQTPDCLVHSFWDLMSCVNALSLMRQPFQLDAPTHIPRQALNMRY